VQVPRARNVMVAPLVPPAVQTDGVVVVKVTGSPELAVALTVNGGSPSVLLGSAPKVMVWSALGVAAPSGHSAWREANEVASTAAWTRERPSASPRRPLGGGNPVFEQEFGRPVGALAALAVTEDLCRSLTW
jgi:hypothetical protein